MNSYPHDRASRLAFTLIELLTVITIIAILMGLLFPAIQVVKDQANKAAARAAVMQIQSAVKNYYTEYGKYPVADYSTSTPPTDIRLGDKSTANAQDDNAELFNILRAKNTGKNTDNTYNPRRISFYEGAPVKDPNAPKNGFLDATPGAGGGVQGALYDPWGKEYTIIIDANYNDVISLSGLYSDFTEKSQDGVDTGARTGVGVFSLGKDGQVGSPKDGVTGMSRSGSKISDDILSWQ
jgi:prepilin-type N-terminal cleavage/methylation domain-containing protein